MATNMTDVPQDLLRHIFECFPEDKYSLSSCGLVCKAWEPAARSVLFRELTVSPDVVGSTAHPRYGDLEVPDWRSAARAFSAMTNLAPYVQVVHFEGGELPLDQRLFSEYDEAERAWAQRGTESTKYLNFCTIDLESLHAIVQTLPNLQKVTFSLLAIQMVALPEHSEPVPIDVLEMNDTGTVRGENPFDILNALRPKKADLNTFHRPLSGAVWPEAYLLPPSATTGDWKLRADPSTEPLIRGLAASSNGRVTALSVDLKNERDLVALTESLAAFGPALKELTLDLWDATWVARPHVFLTPAQFEDYWCNAFSLAGPEGLESFEINIKLGFGEDSMALLASIARVCSTLPPTLRSVHLILDLAYFDPDAVEEMPWSVIGWALNPKAKYHALEKLRLTVFEEEGIDEEDQDIMRQVIVSQLPDLAQYLQIVFVEE